MSKSTTKTATTTTKIATSPARAASPAPSSAKAAKVKKVKETLPPKVKKALADYRKISAKGQEELQKRLREQDEKEEADSIMAEISGFNSEERKAFASGMNKKRARPAKLEGQPSQGRTAYNIFQAEALPAVKAKFSEENDGATMVHSDAMKKVGEIWGQMTADARAPYEEESKKEKETQKPLLEAFRKAHPGHFDESGKRIQGHSGDQEEDEGAASSPSKSDKKKRRVKEK